MNALSCAVLAVLLSTALVGDALAGEESRGCGGTVSQGSQALIFQVSAYLRLASFQGSMLSYQRFLRDRLALRVGLRVDADVSDEDTTYRQCYNTQ